MSIYSYEEAFGAWDKTSRAMRKAVEEWFRLYYNDTVTEQSDPSQRVPYTVVNKLVKTMFGEYKVSARNAFIASVLKNLDKQRKPAVQLALIGGESYLKPCPQKDGFSFTLIPRNRLLVFGRDANGTPTDVGTVEQSVFGKHYYTLLERRTVDARGFLTIENKLYRSLTSQNLGSRVPLSAHPEYAGLAQRYRYPIALGSVGLVRIKTPMVNCVDGSADGVSVYAAAVGLIHGINRNEAQLNGEFQRGQSRVFVSADLLDRNAQGEQRLKDSIFVGLDEDPENVGITVFSPQLREQSYLARKQEYLRNVESIIGLQRGTLSDANAEDRTATEISASAGDYNLTVIDFQGMWDAAVAETVRLCCLLGKMYKLALVDPEKQRYSIDWGNGVLYDEDKTWEDYKAMVASDLLKPEIALGWRFQLPAETEEQQVQIREKLMP